MAWSERVGMVSDRSAEALRQVAREHQRRAKAAVQRAASLRAAVNETFGALVEGRSPRAGWQQLRPFVTAALQKAELTVDHSDRTLAWDFAELESLLWPVAEAAYRLLISPKLQRLKRCAACPWLFLDHSKNGSRRWCSMEDCGTHEKIRRYVTRRAERRTG